MNRKIFFRRIAAWVAAAAMSVSLVGCASGEGPVPSAADSPDSGSTTAATGSWQQQDVTPSENARSFRSMVTLEDGSIQMLEIRDDSSAVLWTSSDSGVTWQQISTDWAQQTGADSFGVTRLLPGGGCFVTAVTTGEGERAFSYWIQDAGSTSLRPITLPDSFVELSDVQPVDEDTLLLLGLTLAPASGDVPDVLVDENGMMRTITVWKMELPSGSCEELPGMANDFGGSTISGMAPDPSEPDSFYSLRYLESGVQLVHTSLDGSSSVVFENLPSPSAFAACSDQDGNYYYASQEGIYRVARGGSLAELIVDGASTVLANTSNTPWGMLRCPDDSFLVVVLENQPSVDGQNSESQPRVYRYYWDADAAAAPAGSSLTVWSLENNDTVRSAITLYEAAHPGCTVNYEIALQDSAETREDAISSLNAALLAGSGPDVIILDDLDWEAYAEKGLLADLTAYVDTDALQANLAAPFLNGDGSACVLPARFSIPVICGSPEDLAAAQTLDDLAQLLLSLPARPAWDASDSGYYQPLDEPYGMGFVSVEQLLDFALEASAPALVEGGVNSSAVGDVLRFVQQVGGYYGMDRYQGLISNGVVSGSDASESVAYGDGSYECFSTRNARMAWDEMLSPTYVQAVHTEEGSFSVALRPGLIEGAFLPRTLVGISVSSTRPEEAGAFVSILFGDEVQSTWQQDGMPVQAASLQNSIQRNCTDDSALSNTQALIDALKTPVTRIDSTVYDTLLENANALIAGETTLEQAQTGVENALALYLAEQN